MNNKILNLINNNKWDSAIKMTGKNPFIPIYNNKTLFHYACLRGNKTTINKYLKLESENIYLSDNDGNTGAHFLAFAELDDLLIEIIKKCPLFLKLKNSNNDFVYDLVKDRVQTLKQIIKIMIDNHFSNYLNFVKHDDRTLLLDIIDIAEFDDKYIPILKTICETIEVTTKGFSIPKASPPLIYAIINNYNKVLMYMLKELHIDVNVKTEMQVTPLALAILQKNTELIYAILKLKPDLNYAGFENKNVPLSMCFKNGLLNIAKKLLDNPSTNSIDYNKRDSLLNTPIYYLIYLINQHRQTMSKEQAIICKDLLKQLIQHSDLDNLNINHESPLHLLVKYKLWQYYKDIIPNEILNFNAMSKLSESPISLMSEEELTDFAELIEISHQSSYQSTQSNQPVNLTDSENVENVENAENINSDNMLSISYELKEQAIMLPKVAINGEFGLFNADGVHNIAYIFVMLKKYHNLTIPTQANIKEKQQWDLYKTSSHCSITDPTIALTNSLMTLYNTTFYAVIPAIIIWKNKNMHFIVKNLMYLERCILSKKFRFVMLRITLVLDDASLHANIVIYDIKLNKLIRFEPYGDWEFNDAYNLDTLLVNTFREAIENTVGGESTKSLKYIRPRDYLDKTKFQTTSMGDNTNEKSLGDPIGYCLAWCFWFLELKLLNPDINEDELVNLALNKIIHNDRTNNNPLLTHIRSYAKQLDSEKNELLELMGFSKTEIYKLSYDNQKLEHIKNYVGNYEFV